MVSRVRAKRIAIIGAGPSGVATAKYLLAEKAFDVVTIYEQSSHVGGLWLATPDDDSEETFTLPSTTPAASPERPIWHTHRSALDQRSSNSETSSGTSGSSSPGRGVGNDAKQAAFLSPIYDSLETNIPRNLMRFSDHYFSDDTQLFPKHETVQSYIEDYARDVRHLIEFETQVSDIRLHHTRQHDSEQYRDIWELQKLNLRTGEQQVETHDAVVCANGHYATPFIPEVPGLHDWSATFPGSISHSKYYRRPETYQGKKVLVIGNSASGSDIGEQILAHCRQPLLISARSSSEMFSASSTKRELPPVSRFDAATRSIVFEGGHQEYNVDNVLFCTGYLYSFPFLQSIDPPLVTDGAYVRNTYQHVFYAPHPTLTVIALPQKVIPFPIAEAQAAVVARYYSGRLSLPPLEEMKDWETQRLGDISKATTSSRADFHKMPFPADAQYINMLCDWAAAADAQDDVGKAPRRWGDWECWCRSRFPAIKTAFRGLGEERHNVTSLEQLGFDFERWRHDQQGES